MNFDLRDYSRVYASGETDRRSIMPTPCGWLIAVIGRREFGRLADRLGLEPAQLHDQIETDTLAEEHWPAVVAVERTARRVLAAA